MERRTILSACRNYRYCLWREWDRTNPAYAVFIGLNPSTADEVEDDPTIRRCVGYAKDWGFGALCMVNLFAFRATNPEALKKQDDPIGPENDRWLVECADHAAVVVAAWGVGGSLLARDQVVTRLLSGRLSCLALTKNGLPKHPLYLKKTLVPVPFC